MNVTQKLFKILSGHDVANGRTDGQTDGRHTIIRPKFHFGRIKRINKLLADNELIDVWRIKNPDTKMYNWHSNTNPPIFCRLDYFFVSINIVNAVSDCSISYGFKTDHSVVSMVLDIVATKRGPGSFKINNSILLETDYQQKEKKQLEK